MNNCVCDIKHMSSIDGGYCHLRITIIRPGKVYLQFFIRVFPQNYVGGRPFITKIHFFNLRCVYGVRVCIILLYNRIRDFEQRNTHIIILHFLNSVKGTIYREYIF